MRSVRTKSPFELWAQCWDAYFQACAHYQQHCFEFAKHALDCHEKWCRTWCFEPHRGTGVIPFIPTADLLVEIDQRSEMGGPRRVPELDGSPSQGGSRTFVSTTNPPFPPSTVCLRILPNGHAWLALVNLASVAPGLPAGDYSIDAFGTPVTARRAQRTEGSLLFGEGVVPGELLADASLGLDIFTSAS